MPALTEVSPYSIYHRNDAVLSENLSLNPLPTDESPEVADMPTRMIRELGNQDLKRPPSSEIVDACNVFGSADFKRQISRPKWVLITLGLCLGGFLYGILSRAVWWLYTNHYRSGHDYSC